MSKDTLGADNFNQIKGQRLIGLFKNNELYNVDVIKNAEVIYYSRNEDQELVGINKSKSGSINIKIKQKAIQRIALINQIDPPLILPKIKGLDDYVPSEEFIDDTVTEKIEAAGKATPNKPNKAARNLPSKDSITNKTTLQKPVIQKPVKEKLKTSTIKKKTDQ